MLWLSVALTGDHHGRRSSRGVRMLLVGVIEHNFYRDTLGQTHPLEVAVDGCQTVGGRRRGAVSHRRCDAVYGTVHDTVAAERRDFSAVPLFQARQFGL